MNESTATPEQMYEYLVNKFAVDTETYDRYRAYQIMVVRYAMYLTSFQKYIPTNIAEDVSDETCCDHPGTCFGSAGCRSEGRYETCV